MKNSLIILLTILGMQDAYGQLSFSKNIIIDNSFGVVSPRAMVSTDLDDDGDLDLLIGSSGDNTISWLENLDGLGNFSKPQIITDIARDPESVYAADVDDDGDQDVIVAFGDNQVAWYENINGDESTWFIREITRAALNVTSVYASDMDGDGDVDIISASSGEVVWYENNNGQIGSQENPIGNETATSVMAEDVDGDGDMDILTSSSSNDSISWYENTDGLGNFSTINTITSNADGAVDVYAADIDNDGDLDVLSASSRDDKIAWYRNNDGQGNFSGQRLISTNADFASSVYAGDLDGDGDMDVLSTSRDDLKVAWYENLNGHGGFSSEKIIADDHDSASIVLAANFDGDNDLDVVSVAFVDDKIEWFKNTDGQGTFVSEAILTTNTLVASSVFSADLDGDGDMDLLSASSVDNEVSWFENLDGAGNYGNQKIIAKTQFLLYEVYASDIDNDGDMDVLSASFGGKKWYENLDGQGNFSEAREIEEFSGGAKSILTADVDGDGDMDVLYSNSTSFGGDIIAWHENIDGLGNFGNGNTISTVTDDVRSIAAADLDADGDMDIVSASADDRTIAWYENTDGQGTFSAQIVIANDITQANEINLVDIDGDDDIDIFSGAEANNNQILWFENTNGLGTFVQQAIITDDAPFVNSIFAGDLDGDGDMDLVSGSDTIADSKIAWYENTDGQGNFGSQQLISTNSELPRSVFVADLNGDGVFDIASASARDGEIAWYANAGLPINQITGNVSFDIDTNGCSSNGISARNVKVVTSNGIDEIATFALSDGSYEIPVGEGDFTTQIENISNDFTSTPGSQSSTFAGSGLMETINFCLAANRDFNDLSLSIIPISSDPIPGMVSTYQMVFENNGTSQQNGAVVFEFDDSKLQFLSASETVTSQTSNSINFNFTGLNPFETRSINLEFQVFTSPVVSVSDELVSIATISPTTGDDNEIDNTFILEQIVTDDYSPNNIIVLEGDEIQQDESSEFLNYVIRFQNSRMNTVSKIVIENSLDQNLDSSTLELQNTSHEARVEIINGAQVNFTFDSINLPSSTNDPGNSYGFVAYRVKPISNVDIGDLINNSAQIFFDSDPAIETDAISTEIIQTLSLPENDLSLIDVYPNPAQNLISISKANGQILTIYNLDGRELMKISIPSSQFQLDTSELISGVYFLSFKSEYATEIRKLIKR